MSFPGDLRHLPPNTIGDDPRVPLLNLSAVQTRMDSLQKFLSDSVNSNTLLGQHQMNMVSDEITSAIHQIIVNGAALLSSTQLKNPPPPPPPPSSSSAELKINLKSNHKRSFPEFDRRDFESKVEVLDEEEEDGGDWEIIELDAVELLAEHIHFCDFCGKGFKRDANLRMHMRAHGNQYKTPEALAKPEKCIDSSNSNKRRRFSCPFIGCTRNKTHNKFRPLKSAICVKNHFKRSHCPKMYSCTRCNKKSFSVLADLKSHLKHCGETKWKCSCGTSFSRKDKLFGHMALFEGHMPAVETAPAIENEKDVGVDINGGSGNGLLDIRTGSDNGFLDRLMLDGFESIDSYCFQDLFESSSPNGTVPNTTGWFV
ncbi:protein SENSITIVE TO PROTON RHIZOTOXICITY 1-like [Solanum pennellii]|uniref:Protein SENSITIVE TO PROTON RHIZOTOXICITY 1-like n=1 Tax=Solanum pennellii TaxID=28526 RepID=A0ABM1GJW0_SOLPN|nr:protein SENSITIVE TO PROTON RHIZOTOXICITY 1-like [Solanum pennellii]